MLAIAQMRTDPTKGLDGDTHTADYGNHQTTCVGESGSWASGVATVADRRVVCNAANARVTKVRMRIRFVDEGGNNTGAEVEIIDRVVYG